MPIEDESPQIEFSPNDFLSRGFTTGGEKRFRQTVKDYSDTLYKAAISIGELRKEIGSNREITNELVKEAVGSIRAKYAQRPKGFWATFAHIFEYIVTLLAGVGASNVAHPWGIFLIVGSAIVWVLLYVKRNLGNRED